MPGGDRDLPLVGRSLVAAGTSFETELKRLQDGPSFDRGLLGTSICRGSDDFAFDIQD